METTLTFANELVQTIKQKPELLALDDSFVLAHLEKNYLFLGSPDLKKYSSFKQCLRNKRIKELISLTRKNLRTVYGLFIKQSLSEKSINSISSINDSFIDLILQNHRSTDERLEFYPIIYPMLFDELKKMGLPDEFTLLDVASGYNPFAYKFFPRAPKKYFACDLSTKEMDLINVFFKNSNIVGQSFGIDVLSDEFSNWLLNKHFDLVFFFKALDSFEQVRRHASKKLLVKFDASFFVVSFSLVSIGGNNSINSSKRIWFERFCESNGWEIKTLQVPNEIFYLVKL